MRDRPSAVIPAIQVRLVTPEVPPGAAESLRAASAELARRRVVVDVVRRELAAAVLEQRVRARSTVTEHVQAVAVRLGVHHEVVVLDRDAASVPGDHVDAQRVGVLICE